MKQERPCTECSIMIVTSGLLYYCCLYVYICVKISTIKSFFLKRFKFSLFFLIKLVRVLLIHSSSQRNSFCFIVSIA